MNKRPKYSQNERLSDECLLLSAALGSDLQTATLLRREHEQLSIAKHSLRIIRLFVLFVMQVSQNELQRKKNEADLLREKVVKLEAAIQEMKQDLSAAQGQRPQQMLKPEASSQASTKLGQGTHSPTRDQEEEEEENAGHVGTESLQREVERLKQQLRVEKEARERLASSFEQERQTWNKEKGKVIKYQKQLQINYLQMHKKNQDLERVLKELTAELENRTELAVDVNYISGLQTYDDVIATEI